EARKVIAFADSFTSRFMMRKTITPTVGT
ncbi:MAG: hypothetical protein AVDCRST_MAG74-391, partial [uncultured Pyrinomonadaceae bacterium]